MENNKQSLKVKIEEVSQDSNEIYVNDGKGIEGWFPIKAPAQIKFCKVGDASITIENGAIVYARNSSPNVHNRGTIYGKPYNAQNQEFKPHNQSNPIVPANQYKDDKPNWDKIGWGKCKFGFLIEAYKLGKSLDVAEKECEAWATASMRQIEEPLKVPFSKEDIAKAGYTEDELESSLL